MIILRDLVLKTRYDTREQRGAPVMEKFVLSCESTVDLPYDYVIGRGLKVLFYTYTVDGKIFTDNMWNEEGSLESFYQRLEEGHIPTTSQINQFNYEEFFREELKKGHDILHLCFGTGMTQSYNQAVNAVEILKNEFPKRKLIVVDTTCSSSGYGMIVDDAADLWHEGKTMEEIVEYLEKEKWNYHHQFYTTDLKYFKRTGRVSGPAATLGSFLKICPIMHLNHAGKIIAYSKVMGERNAIKTTVDTMERNIPEGKDYAGKCFISHSHTLDKAEKAKEAIEERFPNLKGKVKIFDIGPIIACHTGPGTVAVFFKGKERSEN